jgi:hypothetical protein
MNLIEQANRLFLQQLVKAPRGRAHLLAQVAHTEASGEVAVFERLASLASDPEVQRSRPSRPSPTPSPQSPASAPRTSAAAFAEPLPADSLRSPALLPSLAKLARDAAPLTAQSADGLMVFTDLSLTYKRASALLIHQ